MRVSWQAGPEVTDYDWARVLGLVAWLCVGVALAQIPYTSKNYGRVTALRIPFVMRRIPPDERTSETLRDPQGRMGWAGAAAFFCVAVVVLWPANLPLFAIRGIRRARKETPK